MSDRMLVKWEEGMPPPPEEALRIQHMLETEGAALIDRCEEEGVVLLELSNGVRVWVDSSLIQGETLH